MEGDMRLITGKDSSSFLEYSVAAGLTCLEARS